MAKKTDKPLVNPFADAPVMAPIIKAAKSKAKKREEVEIGPMLDKLAAFKVVETMLEAEAKLLRKQVDEITEHEFISQMIESGKKPESFIGVGERAQAMCGFSKKASNVALSAEIIERFDALQIPYEKDVKVPARLVINPDLDQALLQHLAELVKKDPRFKGETVVMMQVEEVKYVVSEDTIATLAGKSEEVVSELFRSVGTLTVSKFKFDDAEITSKHGDVTMPTEDAKAVAISLLQDMGVLPKPEVVELKRKAKKA